MLHIGICDDCEQDRAALRAFIGRTPGFRRRGDLQITEYASGEQLLFQSEDEGCRFDLVFLDIFMGGMSGMDTARALRAAGHRMPLVFLTSSPDFALEGYDVAAAGYLLKPPDPERVAGLLERLLSPPQRPRLAVKSFGRRQYCEYDEIVYLESSDKVTILHLTGGEELRCRERLSVLEQTLADGRFLRCHQSFLVNMDHVKSADQDFHMDNGANVPIRTHGHKAATDAYYQYFVTHVMSGLGEVEDAYV